MSVESLLGPLEIAVIISTVIFGITCLQCYMYYVEHSTNDLIPLKCLVGVLMTLETVHTVLISYILYFYTIKSYPHVPSRGPWSFTAQVVVSVLPSTVTQCFFAVRLYYLNGHRRLLPVTIIVLAIILLVSATTMTVLGLALPRPYTPVENALNHNAGIARVLVTTLCDVIISTSTIYHLHEGWMPLVRMTRAINKLIVYIITTGLLTTAFGLITVILLPTQKYYLTYTPFYFVMTRLYACSLISMLNCRAAVQKEFMHVCDAKTANVFTSVGVDASTCAITGNYNNSE